VTDSYGDQGTGTNRFWVITSMVAAGIPNRLAASAEPTDLGSDGLWFTSVALAFTYQRRRCIAVVACCGRKRLARR
jgi:hypothetical protein